MKHCYLFLLAASVSAAAVLGAISFRSSSSSDIDSLFLAETLAIAEEDEEYINGESPNVIECNYVVCTPSRNYVEKGEKIDCVSGGYGCTPDPECI